MASEMVIQWNGFDRPDVCRLKFGNDYTMYWL